MKKIDNVVWSESKEALVVTSAVAKECIPACGSASVSRSGVRSSSTSLLTLSGNFSSLSRATQSIVTQSNAATAQNETVFGMTMGGGVNGSVQTPSGAPNNSTLSTVNGVTCAVASGPDATAAAGLCATSSQSGATAYGSHANALDTNTTEIDFRSVAYINGLVAIGYQAQAVADPATAIGANSLVSGNNSVVFDAGATAMAHNSIAPGASSLASEDNTVPVGSPGNARRLTNVAPGIEATDAVNVGRLNAVQFSVNGVGSKAYAGVPALRRSP